MTSPQARYSSSENMYLYFFYPPVMKNNTETLSVRECEVLRLLMKGLDTQQVADKLDIKTTTIKTHIRNIHNKLNVCNVLK